MTGLLLSGILAVLAIATTIVDRAAASKSTDDAGRRARGWAFVAFGALWLLPPLVALATFVPVSYAEIGPPRPADPYRASTTWDFDLDLGPVLAAIGLGFVVALVSLAVILFWIGARRGAMRRGLGVPTGRATSRAFSGAAVAATVVALGRLVMGGAGPEDLRWHGSLVVPGDDGWRAHHTVESAIEGPLREVAPGSPMDDDAERWSGSDCCGALASPGGARLSDGLHAWVGDEPVVFVIADDTVTMHPIEHRDAAEFASYPHFAAVPKWAPLRPRRGLSDAVEDRVLLVDDSAGLVAVIADPYGSWFPTASQSGLAARPPVWPLLGALPLWLLALGLRRRAAAESIAGPSRLGASVMLALVTALLAASYAPFFGAG